MSKKFANTLYEEPSVFKDRTRTLLLNKYFNLFMNKYKFKGEGITDEASFFALKKLWATGQIACFKVVDGSNKDGINKFTNGVVCFTPFAPSEFNCYDYPVRVNLINIRGVDFIPNRLMVVDKEVVIGWAQRNKKSIYEIVLWYVDRIADVELTIRNQLFASKFAWLFKTNPENEVKMKQFADRLMSDYPVAYLSVDEEINQITDTFKASNTYVIDKLYMYKEKLENEVLTFLGVNNTGDTEKKEHLITDEVNANNVEIEQYSDCVYDCLQEFCDRVQAVLGFNLEIEVKEPQVIDYVDEEQEESSEGEEKDE